MLRSCSKFHLFAFTTILLLDGTSDRLFAQMLYVGNSADDTMSAYVIDQENGLLTELLPRVPSTGSPNAVAIHPGGKFVFATNSGNANLGVNAPSISSFTINPSTGALSPLGSVALPPGSGPQGAAVDPSGKFLMFASSGAGNVSVYSIDAGGGLSAVPGSPFATPQAPNKVVVHPNGKFAYVSSGSAQIAAFSIGANGALTSVAGSPVAARGGLTWMTMDGAGKFLFALERQDNGVLVYSVDATTGALTQVGAPVPAGPGVSGVAVDPAGKFLYVSNLNGGTLMVFSIGATGALTQIPRGTFPTLFGANDIIPDPSGKFLYVTSTGANAIAPYSADLNSGALTQLSQFIPTGGLPQRGASILLSPPITPPIFTTSAVNFFSTTAAGMPNGGIAQGSRIAISGMNIGPASGVGLQPTDTSLNTALSGVSMQIQSGNVTTPVLMVFASYNLVTGVVPSTTPLGAAAVTVTYKGRTTAPLPITVVPTAFGIRTRGGNGVGPARAMNATADTGIDTDTSTLPVNTLNQSALPGGFILIQGTGLGAITADETQLPTVLLDLPADVLVAGKPANVTAKVRASAGNDFILFQLPNDTPEGCYVPVVVRTGGLISNTATISVAASGGSCSDPGGFTSADIDAAQKSGQMRTGSVELIHITFNVPGLGVVGVNDEISGSFGRYDYNSLTQSFSQGNNGGGIRSGFPTPPFGTCVTTAGTPSRPGHPWDTPGDQTFSQILNAGQALNVNGPQGSVQILAPNFYDLQLDSGVLTPGDYTVDNTAGTPLVGPFKAALTLPAPLNWTNQDDVSSPDRTQDLTVTWTGGSADKEFVIIAGISNNGQAAGGFLCTEKVSAGKFTVPAWILSSLPASAMLPDDSGQILPGGLFGVGTASFTSAGRFTANGLDFARFHYEQAVINAFLYQ